MIVDQLGIRGISVVPPSPAIVAELARNGIAASPDGRIVDLTLAGTRPEVMRAALGTLLSAPEYDMVITVAGSSARFQPHLLVPAIIEAATTASKPLAAFIAPEAPEALAQLSSAGVPCFRTPEACGDAVSAILRRRPAKPAASISRAGHEQQIDEAEGYGELMVMGISCAPWSIVSCDVEASPIGYPIAVKVLAASVVHKTELGGVVLNVANDAELRRAIQTIQQNVAERMPGLVVERLLLQRMAHGRGEALVSLHTDAEAGRVIMLAAGGTMAEIFKDRSLRIAPINHHTAREMISEVKTFQALAGYRGMPKGDLEALADILVRLSRAEDRIVEAEINPLMIGAEGEGAFAVDAVVRIKECGA